MASFIFSVNSACWDSMLLKLMTSCINGSGLVKQGTHDALNTLDAFIIKFGAVVGVLCVLGLGVIIDFAMFVL